MTDTLTPSGATPPAADREPRSGQYLPPERGDYSATFRDGGDFVAIDNAIAWLKARGFSVGEMQSNEPIGIFLGEVTIGKWRTLSAEDHNDLHGKILPASISASMRSGPVTILIRRGAHSAVIEAFRSEAEDRAARAHVEGVEP